MLKWVLLCTALASGMTWAETPTNTNTVVTGQWDFNQGDLSATVGEPLQFLGNTGSATVFTNIGTGIQVYRAMKFPAADSTQGYLMIHGAETNGGGNRVNLYTLIMDIMFPAESSGQWRALFQTDTNQASDSDIFIDQVNGVGISGQYHGSILPDTWHRVALAFNLTNNLVRKYVDGQLVNEQILGEGADGRWSLGEAALLFTDDDNETQVGFVNSIQFREGIMTDEEIAELGGATPGGIGVGPVAGDFTISIVRSGLNVVISVQGATGSFQVKKKTGLEDATWTNVGTPGAGPFTVPANEATALFRVQKL